MKISTKTIVTVGMFTGSPRSSFHSSDSDADRCADHPADFCNGIVRLCVRMAVWSGSEHYFILYLELLVYRFLRE